MDGLFLSGERAAVLPVVTWCDDDLLGAYLIEGYTVLLERWRFPWPIIIDLTRTNPAHPRNQARTNPSAWACH